MNISASDWAPVTGGHLQGSILGLVLFAIFISHLPEVLRSSAKMFANDTKVFCQINSPGDSKTLPEGIDNLVDWSNKWQLHFNASKCKVINLGKNNPHIVLVSHV